MSITSKQEQKVFNCAICKSTFNQNNALAKHIELVHLKSFKIFLTKVDSHLNEKLIKNLTNNFGAIKDFKEYEPPHHQTHEAGTVIENFEDLQNNYNLTRLKCKSSARVKIVLKKD